MAASARDFSWSERALYLCRCGLAFPAQCWRWVDRDARPDLAERVGKEGPWEGYCPGCGRAADGRSAWLEVVPTTASAALVVPDQARGDALDLLRRHLDDVRRRADEVPTWLLTPQLRIAGSVEAPSRAAPPLDESAAVPQAVGSVRAPAPDVPGSAAHVGWVGVADGAVSVTASLDSSARRLWGTAALRARPVHLRELGYPLLGVRVVASYLGQTWVLDGMVDVAQTAAADVFTALSRDFRLDLELRGEGSSSAIHRDVAVPGLERNAALCYESARARLATGEHPPGAFEQALERLSHCTLQERLRPAPHGLSAGDYRYLLSASETRAALAQLDAVSGKENLAGLLEIDGFPVEEYETIRKRVLAASVDLGLCAPQRFWRRIVASGLATDLGDYVEQLARRRAAARQTGDDLDDEAAAQAWRAILQLCRGKGLAVPEPVREALGLPEEDTPLRTRPARSRVAAGEIGASGPGPRPEQLRQRLRQPEQRVAAACEALLRGEGIDDVLAALEAFTADEMLAILPGVAALGDAAVPGLIALLESPRAELRQAAAMLLGLWRDQVALAPLCAALGREPTAAWADIARAVGGFGRRAIAPLCAELVPPGAVDGPQAERLTRALAEVALTADGAAAVSELASGSPSAAAFAAGRALATLDAVRRAGAQLRGEQPLGDVTPVRRFARRAYEAITVLDLEPLEEADVEFL